MDCLIVNHNFLCIRKNYKKVYYMELLKIGTVKYLNSKILNYGLHLVNNKKFNSKALKSLLKYRYEIFEDTPSFLVEKLLKKEINIGLISTVEALKNKDKINYYSELGICALKEVQSIFFIKKDNNFNLPVKRIYLDVSSRSSIALLKILYYKTFYEIPELILEKPENILNQIDNNSGGLLIGDPAIEIFLNSNSFFLKDLATWWYDLTNLPFVFAVWSFRKDLDFDINIFEESYQLGLENINEIIQSSIYPKKFVKKYLTEVIYYRISEQEKKSISLFEEYLKEMDWLLS